MQNGLSDDTVQTLVLLWVFTWLAMILMVARLVMRKIRHQNFDISDKITVVCMVCLLARLAFIHVVLLWGSNNLPEAFRMRHKFSKTEIYQREIGSKLTIISRTFYNT
jgi:phosphatidylserine synthase